MLGISTDLEVDSLSTGTIAGDRLLICSDGLTNMVEDEQIADLLSRQRAAC